MTDVPAQVLAQIEAELPFRKAQPDEDTLILPPTPNHDNWHLGHELSARLTIAAQSNTSLKLLPDGVTYSPTNIGPIQVEKNHILGSNQGIIRVRVRKGFQNDPIAVIYINEKYIKIDSPKLWGDIQELDIQISDTNRIIEDLETKLLQYQHFS